MPLTLLDSGRQPVGTRRVDPELLVTATPGNVSARADQIIAAACFGAYCHTFAKKKGR